MRNIERFNELTEIETGRCYATRVFAAGQFDAAIGGVLKLKDRDDIKLVILPNALEKTTQSIYMMLMSDPLDRGPSYSPVVECGPSGLKFKVGVNQSFYLINQEMQLGSEQRKGILT